MMEDTPQNDKLNTHIFSTLHLSEDEVQRIKRQIEDYFKDNPSSPTLMTVITSTPLDSGERDELARLRQQLSDIKDAFKTFEISGWHEHFEDDDELHIYPFDVLWARVHGETPLTLDEWTAQREADDTSVDDPADPADSIPAIEPTRDLAAELKTLEDTLAGYQALLPQCVSDLDVRMTQQEIETTRLRIAGVKHLMGVSDE